VIWSVDRFNTCNVEYDLSDILHVRQRLERVQVFLDDEPQGPWFILIFSIGELGVVEQARNLLVRRIRIEDDILSVQDLGEVVEGPFVPSGPLHL